MTTVSPPWTPDDDKRAIDLHKQGLSYSEIGAELCRTKNAVAGRMKRLGLAKPLKQEVENRRAAAKERQKKEVVKVINNLPFAEPKPVSHPLHMRRVTIDDLTPRTCRFPLGESNDPDLRYCGDETLLGSSWCASHHRIVFVPKAPPKKVSLWKAYR